MGTNYYQKSEPCPHCGKADEPLHIGKSSAGWAFQLHVIPERGINGLTDWEKQWAKDGTWIENEYGDRMSKQAMFETITSRRVVLRSTVDGFHCIGHGDGTWDLIQGDFS
jgi:hypothetical protein